MKNLMMIVLSVFLLNSVVVTNAHADAAKGLKYYKKYLKPLFGIKGNKFTTSRTKGEWKSYFKKNAKKFIKKYSKKYPKSADFLKSDKFQKIAPHVKDFAIKFAADSGALPKCN
jgi:mRNA degradation ribonuclease J1/J2